MNCSNKKWNISLKPLSIYCTVAVKSRSQQVTINGSVTYKMSLCGYPGFILTASIKILFEKQIMVHPRTLLIKIKISSRNTIYHYNFLLMRLWHKSVICPISFTIPYCSTMLLGRYSIIIFHYNQRHPLFTTTQS